MNIKILTDEDFGLSSVPFRNPRVRNGARGIVFNTDGKIAILYKKVKNEYKLIGGGIDAGEEPEKAFVREVWEETGCRVVVDKFLGFTIEEKSHDNFKQKSYVYVAHVVEDTATLHLTEQEIGEGSLLLWVSLDEALIMIQDCENHLSQSPFEGDKSIYHSRFIVRRDYEILLYFKNHSLL